MTCQIRITRALPAQYMQIAISSHFGVISLYVQFILGMYIQLNKLNLLILRYVERPHWRLPLAACFFNDLTYRQCLDHKTEGTSF